MTTVNCCWYSDQKATAAKKSGINAVTRERSTLSTRLLVNNIAKYETASIVVAMMTTVAHAVLVVVMMKTVAHAVLVVAMMKTVAHAVSVRAVTVVQAVEPCNF